MKKMSKNTGKLCSIPASQFYKNCNRMWEKMNDNNEHNRNLYMTDFNFQQMPQRLMGPTQDWSVLYKQADALNVAREKNLSNVTLMTFVYEQSDGRRVFIVAHPEVYWWYFKQRLPEKRCAYEVIPEDSPCSLYLDLEFQRDLNKNSNGPRMTKTIIDIICRYLKAIWDINCDETNVLNLDSTTNIKFSRHLIFRINNVAFKNNIQAGKLINIICNDINDYLISNANTFHSILSFIKREYLEELIINTNKKQKLFIDTGVYTRNRHFRIYQATKWGKLSHLQLSMDNKYIPLMEMKDKELGIFLESLVSYFSDKRQLIYLTINEHSTFLSNTYREINKQNSLQRNNNDQVKNSQYPAIDKFILDLVYPGTIREIKYFETTQMIAYEIVGNRYCANIGRPHKSNNIYWVVDLKRRCAYQKCHDQDDCTNFKSNPTPFPLEINFLVDADDDDLFLNISNHYDDSTESGISQNHSL